MAKKKIRTRPWIFTDEEIERMRAANLPVPETLEEVRQLLKIAEDDPRSIPLKEAFAEIYARLDAKWEAEIEKRIADVESGKVKCIDGKEAILRVRNRKKN